MDLCYIINPALKEKGKLFDVLLFPIVSPSVTCVFVQYLSTVQWGRI